MKDHSSLCAEVSLARNEPMIGTANKVDAWLMLEYRGEWRAKATTDNDLPESMNAWLDDVQQESIQRGMTPRIQFIKSERSQKDPLVFFLAYGNDVFRHEFNSYEDIVSINPFDENVEPVEETLYFVCVNGQRDLCCSRLGSIAYRELREVCPDRCWRTTHLGGHRFAPNVLVLPDNLLYGRVFSDVMPEFVEHAESGKVYKPLLRGRGIYSPEQQVCELLANGAIREIEDNGDGTYLCFTDRGEETVVIEPPRPTPILASCGDAEEKLVPVFTQTG